MSVITFIYMNNLFKMKNSEINFISYYLINKYASLLNKDIKELCFLYNGKYLKINRNKFKIKSSSNKIFVFD